MENRYKKLRKENRYTMKEMAKLLDVSQSYYQKIEYGIRKPSREFLRRLKTTFPQIDLNIYIQ